MAMKHTGWTLIHVGLQKDERFMDICFNMQADYNLRIPHEEFKYGGIIGAVKFGPPVRESESRWFFGPCGYPVIDFIDLPFTKMKGKLGFFNVPAITFTLP